MLLSTYNPDAQGHCPVCEKFCKDLYMLGGNMAFYPRHLILTHRECGAKWRYNLDTRDRNAIFEILEPPPLPRQQE